MSGWAERSAARSQGLGAGRQAGFTLLELLVVVLIIGLLAGVVAPRFMAQISRSEATAARAQIDALSKAVQAYRIDMGRFPGNDVGLRGLVDSGGDARWRGPYLQGQLPTDPWGQPYRYRYPGTAGRDFDIVSHGADRAPGGSGASADVTN